ncbi:MAG: O-succinylbenzoate--CoA ligase [Pseudonocardiales bacterium]|nr:AMP-binding protein [Actinomycetota bacterium]PZS19940.1 MAG: O-succinylbenzoate--CoA ligase [Pseudonocardiales bacterium]
MTTLRELVIERAETSPHRCFLADARSERSLDFAMLRAAADAWRRELDAAGVPPGARVLVDVDDPLAFCAVHLAVIAAGRCSVPVDPAAPAAQAQRTRRSLQPWLVVSDRAAIRDMRVNPATGLPADPAAPVQAGGERAGEPRTGSVALLTSGSTGTPKTVVLTECQLLHAARCVVDHHELSSTDRGFNPLPLFHINAQVVAVLATLVGGGSLVLDRRFHRTGFWQLLVQQRITWLNAVPAILSILALEDVPAVPATLRFIRSASAPLPAAARDLVTARSGVAVVESYGMTEAASQITVTPLSGGHPAGSVGGPVGVELEVVESDGQRCAPGVVGRVRIRGESVISSYAEGAAADRIDAAGWLDTGDLGRLDADGYLYLAGRRDDVVNCGGELVHPSEVEQVLLGEPAVAEAAVAARPHEVLGAVPVAWIRPVLTLDDEQVSELISRLRLRCEQQLSRVKRPVEFRIVTGLPQTSTGKVARHRLRELLVADTRRPEPVPL